MITSAEEFVQLRLSADRQQYTRAAHDTAPTWVWIDVIERFPDMKKWVAHNKTVPIDILQILANDDEPNVRLMVAKKRKLSLDIFEKLAYDSEESVRFAIANNRSTPSHVLENLLNDKWERVVRRAKERLSEMEYPE